MNFFRNLFNVDVDNTEENYKKAHKKGYKEGVAAGIRVGKQEGEQKGWKAAMSKIANLADEMTIKKDFYNAQAMVNICHSQRGGPGFERFVLKPIA